MSEQEAYPEISKSESSSIMVRWFIYYHFYILYYYLFITVFLVLFTLKTRYYHERCVTMALDENFFRSSLENVDCGGALSEESKNLSREDDRNRQKGAHTESCDQSKFECVELDMIESKKNEDLIERGDEQRENEEAHQCSEHGDAEAGNAIMISAEDLAAAGLDIDNLSELTEEQLNTLMAIADQRNKNGDDHIDEQLEGKNRQDSGHGHNYIDMSVAVPSTTNDSITMVITDDGSLKLTDASGQVFFLADMSIDVNNLTDDSIQQIVHMAMPAINIGKSLPTRSKSEAEQSAEIAIYDHGININDVPQSSSNGSNQYKSSSIPELVSTSQLIGERVEVRRQGKSMLATVRYVRSGGSCKVQFDDGHFEWITEDNITLRGPRRTDHSSYHGIGIHSGEPRVVQAPAVASLKRPGAGSVPLLSKRAYPEPNFCCPICDRKVGTPLLPFKFIVICYSQVYQEEPAYIVIRLPACDSCTREKIIVLDEPHSNNVPIPPNSNTD
uniref:LITAF domain-containing protein n=1 Tax=Heterorhabditis bacteriophora TaxID=37862 RepID=A0A1I7XU45_HETBA